MKTIYSPSQALHNPQFELNEGKMMPAFEHSGRSDNVLAALKNAGFSKPLAPQAYARSCIERVHAPAYVNFLQTAYTQWHALHPDRDALPLNWPTRHFSQQIPVHIDGKLGYYSFDAGTPITAGTWQAVEASAASALTAADLLLRGETSAFALCRPPGHHAASDLYGGYCFLNNAAIAAQYLRDQGKQKIAVLDIDYHHGNGTQSIFYQRDDVLFISIHADPAQEYPYFLGYANEIGAEQGEGFNLNIPLPCGTDWQHYRLALRQALQRISDFSADAMIVSLGLDTYAADPISQFKLATEDYQQLGADLAELSMPVAFVFEGGYAVDALGTNLVELLNGYLRHH